MERSLNQWSSIGLFIALVAAIGVVGKYANDPIDLKTKQPDNKFSLPVRTKNGVKKNYILDPKRTVAYLDFWKGHWCPYYSDRGFLYISRVNEVLQKLRAIGIQVIDISPSALSIKPEPIQVKNTRTISSKAGDHPIKKYSPSLVRKDQMRRYYPNFKDTCVYSSINSNSSYLNTALSEYIALSSKDAVVTTFLEGSLTAVGSKATTVLFLGQHTNMCLMSVALLCKRAGLRLIVLRDIVDTCWDFHYQNRTVPTHSKGNTVTNAFFEREMGATAISYDLIRAMQHINPVEIEYTNFTTTSHLFGKTKGL